jgi:Group II intron, maturase-specific domain
VTTRYVNGDGDACEVDLPGVSVEDMRLQRRGDKTLGDLARMFNVIVQGWINYRIRQHRPPEFAIAWFANQPRRGRGGHRHRVRHRPRPRLSFCYYA